MNVGEVLKALRVDRGLTQETLALDAGVATSYLSRIERGKRQAPEETLRRLTARLGITLADLYAKVEGSANSGYMPPRLREAEPRDYELDAIKLRRLFRDLNPANRQLATEFVRLLHKLQKE